MTALHQVLCERLALLPALTGCEFGTEPWRAGDSAARGRSAAELGARAIELQLTVALPGEAAPLPLASRAAPPRPGGDHEAGELAGNAIPIRSATG